MDKEKQRIAIAQLMGFKCQVCPVTGRYWLIPPKYQDHMKPETLLDSIPDLSLWEVGKVEGGMSELPDFLNDLNAINDAVNYLRNANRMAYLDYGKRLDQLVAIYNSSPEQQAYHGILTCDAPADMRARAVLESLNLWTPTGEENE